MRDSLRLGSFAGIGVGAHWSILLIAALLTASLAGTILPASAAGYASISYLIAALATTGLFLASIVAHELGHSIVAENNDVKVEGITLFALGGVAKLEREPDTPGAAARIAIAGPLVSVGIGVAALIGAAIAGLAGLSPLATAGLTWLGVINLVLAVFNMIPALPLDGGRVLQAALWKRNGNRHTATIGAATVGRYMGWALVALGVWQFTNGGAGLWTAFIGLFIITSARAEEFRARFLRKRDEWTANPPFIPGPIPPTRSPWEGDDIIVDVEGRRVDVTT